ncbi:MAG: DnaK suppressor protein [Patiriisocius sp.]|jgi:DnaK suppressor protein
MDSDKKNELEILIKDNIIKLEKEIVTLKELTKPIPPENAIGRISRMDAINNKSVNEAALRSSELKLRKLLRAKERLREDSYGLCGKCGIDINPMRLMLLPESNFCVRCAAR